MEDGNKNGDLACHAAGDACTNYAVLPYINSHDIAKFEVKWRNRDNYNRIEILVIFQKDKILKFFIFI